MLISITKPAAAQIKLAAMQGNAKNLPLRLEIDVTPEGAFHYRMGFDEHEQIGDEKGVSQGISFVVGANSQARASGLVLDYVSLAGQMEFIFLNPNDPNYRPPQE